MIHRVQYLTYTSIYWLMTHVIITATWLNYLIVLMSYYLLKTKCVPVLLYGLEALPLNKSQISSIDFVINRFFMNPFNTNNIEIVKCCQQEFCFSLPSHFDSSHRKLFRQNWTVWQSSCQKTLALLKLCKTVGLCWYLIACLCRSVLPNVNVNFLEIMLNLITYYATSVKTLRHMSWIC